MSPSIVSSTSQSVQHGSESKNGIIVPEIGLDELSSTYITPLKLKAPSKKAAAKKATPKKAPAKAVTPKRATRVKRLVNGTSTQKREHSKKALAPRPLVLNTSEVVPTQVASFVSPDNAICEHSITTKPCLDEVDGTTLIEESQLISALEESVPQAADSKEQVFKSGFSESLDILQRIRRDYEGSIQRLRAEYYQCLLQMRDDANAQHTRWQQRVTQAVTLLGPDEFPYASIGTLKGSPLGSGSVPPEDAIVLYMTASEFAHYSRDRPKALEKPIVIPNSLELQPDAYMARFIDALEVFCARNVISVQDLSLDTRDENDKPVDSYRPVDTSVVLQHIRNPQSRLFNEKEALPLNLLDLQDFNLLSPPAFLSEPRYQLLRVLDERTEASVRQTSLPQKRRLQNPTLRPGKKHFEVKRPSDVSSCQRFTIFAQRGSYSGPHTDFLNGTWVQCLAGLKLWIIFPNLHNEEDQCAFEDQGSEWLPSKRQDAQIIVLAPGDLLIMPAGEAIVHAPITAEDCLMVGGMYWDTQNICAIIGNIAWILENPAVSNERNLQQLPAILEKLDAFVHEFPRKFVADEGDVEGFLKEWKEVHAHCVKTLMEAIRDEEAEKKRKKGGGTQKKKKEEASSSNEGLTPKKVERNTRHATAKANGT